MPMTAPLEVVLGKGDGGAAVHAGAPSPERFTTLALFFASSCLYSGSWICFAPVANLAAGARLPRAQAWVCADAPLSPQSASGCLTRVR